MMDAMKFVHFIVRGLELYVLGDEGLGDNKSLSPAWRALHCLAALAIYTNCGSGLRHDPVQVYHLELNVR
jgi:hypothetical protein